jgi:hypothetical protein
LRSSSPLTLLAGLALAAAATGAEERVSPNPFGTRDAERSDAVQGLLTRSNGDAFAGRLYLTRDKRLELYSDAARQWHRLRLRDLRSLEWNVEFEREEREWRWKHSGSDVKVYTGRKKLDRRYRTVATTLKGERIEGHIRGTVIYVQSSQIRRKFFLYWNHPSDFDQKPEGLLYVARIDFGARHYPLPEQWPPLSEKQVAATAGVFAELEKELGVLGGKHRELKGLGGSRRRTESQDGVTLELRTRPGGAGALFRCARAVPDRKPPDQPAATFNSLGLHVYWRVLEPAAGPRPGAEALADLRAGMQRATSRLRELEAGAARGAAGD